ncbi:MAG: hypothetical protein U0R51_00935 [Solirubrobacterales bacterium]
MGIGRSIRFIAGAACGIGWALASAVSADAFVDYAPPTSLDSGVQLTSEPELLVGPDGSRLVIWESLLPSAHPSVAYSQSGPTGPFGAVEKFVDGQLVDAAIGPDGTATLVWLQSEGSDQVVETAQLAPDGTLGTVHELTPRSNSQFPYPWDVVVDSQGKATITYWWEKDGIDRAKVITVAPNGNPGSSRFLSEPSGDAWGAMLAVDDNDRVTAVWEVDGHRLASRRIDGAGNMSAQGFVAPTTDGEIAEIRLVAADSGIVTLAWRQADAGKQTIESRLIAPSGNLKPIRRVSDGDQIAADLDLALNPNDRARLVWSGAGADNYRIRTALLDRGGRPGDTEIVSAEGRDAGDPSIAFDSSGRAHVVWDRFDGTTRRVQATRLQADGSPGTITTLSPTSFPADRGSDIAVGLNDRPTVVWGGGSGSGTGLLQYSRASLVPPETTITSGPADGSATPDDTPTFGFASNADDATFDCSIDGAPFSPCTSPLTLPALVEGAHSFAARATDPDGIDATPAAVGFTYDPDADPLDTKVEGRVVKASEKQRQKSKKIRIAVKAGADEDVTATLTGTVDPKGKKKPLDLQKIKAKPVDGGDLRKFTLVLRRDSDNRKLTKSLKKDGSAKAKVKVTLVDPSLNDTSKSVSMKVTR